MATVIIASPQGRCWFFSLFSFQYILNTSSVAVSSPPDHFHSNFTKMHAQISLQEIPMRCSRVTQMVQISRGLLMILALARNMKGKPPYFVCVCSRRYFEIEADIIFAPFIAGGMVGGERRELLPRTQRHGQRAGHGPRFPQHPSSTSNLIIRTRRLNYFIIGFRDLASIVSSFFFNTFADKVVRDRGCDAAVRET